MFILDPSSGTILFEFVLKENGAGKVKSTAIPPPPPEASVKVCGLAFLKPCPSAVVGFGSSCGCFASNSDVCTRAPFHSIKSLYDL